MQTNYQRGLPSGVPTIPQVLRLLDDVQNHLSRRLLAPDHHDSFAATAFDRCQNLQVLTSSFGWFWK